MAAMVISFPPQRSKAKHHNNCAGFLLGKPCIKIVIFISEAIGSLSICQALHELFPCDNDRVKLVLRCLICLRLNELASRASVKLSYAVLREINKLMGV